MSAGSRIAFGVNAAHGVSLQAAATWSPTLAREPRLLVPVHLDVLMVRSSSGIWARCGLAPDANGELRAPPPFAELDAPRKRGAYLMWAPPDALARGLKSRTDAEGPIRFPALPDRWLVLRLFPSPRDARRRTLRGWVLRADRPDAAPVDLDQWIEKDANDGIAATTVVGPGQLNWVGYFDNVHNRYAFHDDLADVPAGPLAYLVCGWYADDDLDPLADPDIHSQTDFETRLREFGWSLPEHAFREAQAKALKHTDTLAELGMDVKMSTKAARRATSTHDAMLGGKPEAISETVKVARAAWWPRHTLCHGAVVGLGWPGVGWSTAQSGVLNGEVGGPPAAAAVSVGIGTTLSEALATLVAKRAGTPAQSRLLQAFQLGALSELDQADGRARIDVRLHTSGFVSMPGGNVTERVWEPPIGEPPRNPSAKVAGHGVFERYYKRVKRGRGVKEFFLGGEAKARSAAAVKAASAHSSQPRAFGGAPQVSIEAIRYSGKALQAESDVLMGRAGDTLARLGLAGRVAAYKPGRWVDHQRPLPRLFRPIDPVIVLEGIKRPYQHGGDGRFSSDGTLGVRITGAVVKDYRSARLGRALNGEDILDRGVMNGSVPPECEELLTETALLDPGSASAMVSSGAGKTRMAAATMRAESETVMVHQTALWALRDPRVDHSAVVSLAPYTGLLPSPVAVNIPSRPWNPLHLDWRVEYTPSPGGRADWDLGEIDYNESAPAVPPAGSVAPLVIEGRSPLSAGAGQTLAAAIRRSVDEALRSGTSGTVSTENVYAYASEIGKSMSERIGGIAYKLGGEASVDAQERATLGDLASALEQMDALSAGLDGLHRGLRAGFAADGAAAPADGTVPAGFFALRGGFLRILRLRVVDGFGQVLDLAGSSASKAADPARIARGEPLEVTGRAELLALPPRLTAPARLWLRFTDAAGGPDEARTATDRDEAVSPVCGYLMPNHLDDALLFFDADGSDSGVVRRDERDTIVWEDAPGAPSTVGASPAQAIANPFLADVAQGLLDWGVADAGLDAADSRNDTALRALMRTIDTTRWTTDPFGHQGEEHLALLVGHPIVVLRAVLRLEVQEPVDPQAAAQAVFPVRLGALAQWQDGLLGYFVNDDYRHLHCTASAAAELARAFGQGEGYLQGAEQVGDYAAGVGSDAAAAPVTHPYLDRSGIIQVRPNQDVRLTLLLEPNTLVHVTSGILPRKEVGLRRDWTDAALARLSPTFRFGPVLVDPKQIRMPVAAHLHGTWSWDHRKSVTEWENLPVTHATQDALLPQDAPMGSEGWLRLRPIVEGES